MTAATLLQKHNEYMERWKDSGQGVLILKTPCCNHDLEVQQPPRGDRWDSLMTCPFCDELFMKVATHNRAIGKVVQS